MTTETQAHEVRMARFKERLVKRGFIEADAEDEARDWVSLNQRLGSTKQKLPDPG